MPSSTSSSELAPRGQWPSSWLLALVIVLACMGSWEGFWRSRDFTPSVTDDAGLWALARHRANLLGEDAVVLVGSSRMQMDLQRNAFARATGWKPAVQLAVTRGPTIPVLENLASDPRFHGTVICEVYPTLFFAKTPQLDQMLDEHFRAFDESSAAKRIEQRLSMVFQRNFVSRLPDLTPARLYQAWQRPGRMLPTYNAIISDDRFRYGDYFKIANLRAANRRNAEIYEHTTPKLMTPAELTSRLDSVDELVGQIQSRGGQVIFVHLPASFHVLDYERRWWKRRDTWDKLAETTRASAVHYLDYPSLAVFKPPDGIHLARDAADVFSQRFGEILVELSLAPGPDPGGLR